MKFMKIGEFIKRRRKELNLSQSDIADALFVTIPTVSKWENNGRIPDISFFSSLAKILKVDLESFVKGESKLNNDYDIENTFNLDAFAKHFVYLRKVNNFTLSTLAKEIDVSYQTISKWENKESAPNIYLMIKCAEIFNVSLAELYYGKNFVKVTDNKKVTKNKNVLFGITGIVAFVSIALCICVPLLINNNSMSSPIQIGEDGENEMFSFTVQSNNSVILNEYLGNETEVIIPSKITYKKQSFNVTEMSFGFLRDCTNIEKLVIPFVGKSIEDNEKNHLGYIFGAESFEFNKLFVPSSLKELSITNAEKIEKYALCDCSNIEKVVLPSNLKYIGLDAFLGCTSLVYNEFGNVNYLGTETNPYFALVRANDFSISECSINENTVLLGCDAFRSCSLINSITIPQSVLYSCEDVFTTLSNLERVYYEGSIEQWLNIDFTNFRSNPMYNTAKEFYTKNEKNEYIEVKDIIIPTSISTIKQFAFDGFDNVESIYISENVFTIEKSAFSYCKSLKSIFIPNSVVKMGKNVFSGCDNNIQIYCESTSKPVGWDELWYGIQSANVIWGATRK